MAGTPAVAEEVDVQLELLAGRCQREHLVMEQLEWGARLEQPQAHADARDVRVDGHVMQPVGEQQHAGRGLAADAGQGGEVVARLLERDVREPVLRQLGRRLFGEHKRRPIFARRLLVGRKPFV